MPPSLPPDPASPSRPSDPASPSRPSDPAPPSLPSDPARRIAYYALAVCVLAVAAAVVSFARGSWLGVVWVLLAGLSSNMAWYYLRQARAAHQKR